MFRNDHKVFEIRKFDDSVCEVNRGCVVEMVHVKFTVYVFQVF